MFSRILDRFSRVSAGCLVGVVALTYIPAFADVESASDLEQCFFQPQADAKPWVFWYWIADNVTKEGITYDLESMADAGIGGAYIFSISRPGYEQYLKLEKAVKAPSDEFWGMVTFAVQEANRLGMEIALNACDGWSLAGGPWITPELSMQKLVSTTTVVDGGSPISKSLPKAQNNVKASAWQTAEYNDYYRDIAVLAYPVAPGWNNVNGSNWKSAQQIKRVDEKTGAKAPHYTVGNSAEWTSNEQVDPLSRVSSEQILDLTAQMDSNGQLDWTPPKGGKWLIQRFGYVTTGQMNRPTTGAIGLECDKLNPEAAKVQFDHWFGEAVRRAGPELAKSIKINHTDSWECGGQNWSPVFREEFIKRRGYDPVKYLPVTTGVAVGSAEESERFLWDFRRTLVDLISDSFFRTMVARTHNANALYSSETMGGMMSDSMEFYREVDLAMGEFWIGADDQGSSRVPPAVFGGHIYGKRIIQAEAFTQRLIRWTEDPYFLKPLGDYQYTRGLNRFVLHVWSHQAFPERVPGVTLFNVFGTSFSGSQPWMKTGGHAWIRYLTRNQAMLQQGIPVADVCYFIGEDLPNNAIERQDLKPALPFGYDYDCINRDALLTRVVAKDGRMVLPDGISYKLLVLPDSARMSPEVAEKIGELAEAGVRVIGLKPDRTYSLKGYPESDKELKQIVSSSWRNVQQGISPLQALQNADLAPDVEFLGADMSWIHRGDKVMKTHSSWNKNNSADVVHKPELDMEYSSPAFAFCHRRTVDADFYFVSNQELENKVIDVAFRIEGKQPELWHPETGKISDLNGWTVRDGRTFIPLKFSPAESYFVVFRRAAGSSGTGIANFPAYQTIASVEGKWTVSFEPGRGAPAQVELAALASLSDSSDPGVKYFSGTAMYRKEFTPPASVFDRKEGERIILDLGQVKNVAEVTLNGKVLPVAWKPPFMVDVTDALKPGGNDLVVKVSNTWKNRLIADAALPVDKRITWTLFREEEGWFSPKSPGKSRPEPSGLIGPVVLMKESVTAK